MNIEIKDLKFENIMLEDDILYIPFYKEVLNSELFIVFSLEDEVPIFKILGSEEEEYEDIYVENEIKVMILYGMIKGVFEGVIEIERD